MTVIESIKQAEQKAAEIRRDAVAVARDITADSAIDRQRMLDKKLGDAEKKAEVTRNKLGESAQRKADAVIEQGAESDLALERRARKELELAVRFVVDRVAQGPEEF